jgi:hypothetical protein
MKVSKSKRDLIPGPTARRHLRGAGLRNPRRWELAEVFPPHDLSKKEYSQVISQLESLDHFKAFKRELDLAFPGSPVLRDSVMRACKLAAYAHRKETPRYNGLPYVSHALAVATGLLRLKGEVMPALSASSPMASHAATVSFHNAVVAALLHDSMENESLTVRDIERSFGGPIAASVSDLTTPRMAQANFRTGAYRYLSALKPSAKRYKHFEGMPSVFRSRYFKRPPELIYPQNMSRYREAVSFETLQLALDEETFRKIKEEAYDYHLSFLSTHPNPLIPLVKALDVMMNLMDNPKPMQLFRYTRNLPVLLPVIARNFPGLAKPRNGEPKSGKWHLLVRRLARAVKIL